MLDPHSEGVRWFCYSVRGISPHGLGLLALSVVYGSFVQCVNLYPVMKQLFPNERGALPEPQCPPTGDFRPTCWALLSTTIIKTPNEGMREIGVYPFCSEIDEAPLATICGSIPLQDSLSRLHTWREYPHSGVWTFSGVSLSHLNQAAGDSPIRTGTVDALTWYHEGQNEKPDVPRHTRAAHDASVAGRIPLWLIVSCVVTYRWKWRLENYLGLTKKDVGLQPWMPHGLTSVRYFPVDRAGHKILPHTTFHMLWCHDCLLRMTLLASILHLHSKTS